MKEINSYILEKFKITKKVTVYKVLIIYKYYGQAIKEYEVYDDVKKAAQGIRDKGKSWQRAELIPENIIDDFINFVKEHGYSTEYENYKENHNIQYYTDKVCEELKKLSKK